MALPAQNLNNSAFKSMLEREKLSGPKFNDWFRQLRIVLQVETKLNVLEQPMTPAPVPNTPNEELEAWNAQYDHHNKVGCLMLISMSPELQRQFENYSPYDMLHELKSMFKNKLELKALGWHLEEIHVTWAHLGKKRTILQLYTKVDEENAYSAWRRRQKYRRRRQDIKVTASGYLRRRKCKGKSKLAYAPKPKNPPPAKKEHSTKNVNFHHYKEVGYWRRKRHVYLAELMKKKKEAGSASTSGEKKLKQGALYLYVGNRLRAGVEAIGSFDLVIPNGLVIVLNNCHYAPTITRGVVSVLRLVDNGFVQCFTDYGISVSKNNAIYFNAIPRDGIYEIDILNLVPNVNSIYTVSNKRSKHNLDSTYLWHCRLAHIKSTTRILNMVPTKKVDKTPYELWFGIVLNLSYLKVLGFETLMKCDTPEKLQQGYVKCIFVGYPKETMGYYFYIPPENKTVVARYDEFFEMNLITQEASGRALELEEIQEEDTSHSENTSEHHVEAESLEPQIDVALIRKSERTHRAPDRLCLNVEGEEHSLGDLNDHVNYKAALSDPESDKWLDAMNAEMKFMKDNQV
ncbi:hypothetical protein Tco_0031251 [Tanacetum coccineum]